MKIQNTESRPENSSLGSINQIFHSHYRKLVEQQRKLIDKGELNIIVRMDDRLSLFQGQEETRFYVNSELYHHFKAVSHIALTTFLVLEYRQASVEDFTSLVQRVDVNGDRDAQQVISICLDFLINSDKTKLAYQTVREFGNSLSAPLAKFIDRAAQDEVRESMLALGKLEREFAIDWSATYLVVCDGNQPRYKNLSKMLFRRWVESRSDHLMQPDHHVIYGESCESYDDVVDLLSRHLAGSIIGDVFLKSPSSFNQDVLGDAAKRAIEAYFFSAELKSYSETFSKSSC